MNAHNAKLALVVAAATVVLASGVRSLSAAPLPGGTLDPLTIPKYVTPLVIPPEMPRSTVQPVDPANPAAPQPAAHYNIALRTWSRPVSWLRRPWPAGSPSTTRRSPSRPVPERSPRCAGSTT